MELKVINEKGEAQKSVDANENLFGREYNELAGKSVTIARASSTAAGFVNPRNEVWATWSSWRRMAALMCG